MLLPKNVEFGYESSIDMRTKAKRASQNCSNNSFGANKT